MSPRHWTRLPFLSASLRSETALVLPLATTIVVALSIIAVLLYAAALRQLRESEQEERLSASQRHLSQIGSEQASSATWPIPFGASDLMVLDAQGIAIAGAGEQEGANLLLPLTPEQRRRALSDPVALGPNAAVGHRIVVYLPIATEPSSLGAEATPAIIRIDWPTPVLARHQRRVPLLAGTVGLADCALLLLVFVYRRQRLQPLEGLIERARSVAGSEDTAGGSAGEVRHLLATFDRALAELKERGGHDPLSEAIRDSITTPARDDVTTGLLLIDSGGHLLALNETGARWLGTQLDVTGQHLDEVLSGQPELLSVLRTAIDRGEPVRRRECPIRTSEGQRVIGLTLSRLSRADGTLRGWLGLFTDLTSVQRENREAMLTQSLAQIAEMSAGLAHELRNGMASLRGYATLLQRSQLAADQAEDLAEMKREIDHLHRVAEDFLSFARPGTARSEPLDLLQLAHRAAADPALAEARVEVQLVGEALRTGGSSARSPFSAGESPAHTTLDDRARLAEGSELRGDAQLIERALRNLLHNAVRSHRDRDVAEPILLRVRLPSPAAGGHADAPSVEVLDRGPGIPAELRDKLFLPFARGNEDGVGLGLALARRIADLHQADLELLDREGGGTRAVLRFSP